MGSDFPYALPHHTHNLLPPLTLITHAVCLWCVRVCDVLSMRFISTAVPISHNVSYLLSFDIAISCASDYMCMFLRMHIHTSPTTKLGPARCSTCVSRATKLSGSLGTPGLPVVNLEALLECHKLKTAPTVDAATKAVHKSWGRVHARVRSYGYFCL